MRKHALLFMTPSALVAVPQNRHDAVMLRGLDTERLVLRRRGVKSWIIAG